jgi:hypothetical protein
MVIEPEVSTQDFADAPVGAWRAHERVEVSAPDGSLDQMVGPFPGAERYRGREGVRGGLPFGHGLHVIGRGDRIAVGDDDAYRIRLYDSAGHLLWTTHQDREPDPVSNRDIHAKLQELLAWSRSVKGFARYFKETPWPSTFPAYESLRIGADGTLWVEEYRRPGEDKPVWQVFDRKGVLIARLALPPGMQLLDMRADHILGLSRTQNDVEQVGWYRLRKGSR